jgi:hypothetical protein
MGRASLSLGPLIESTVDILHLSTEENGIRLCAVYSGTVEVNSEKGVSTRVTVRRPRSAPTTSHAEHRLERQRLDRPQAEMGKQCRSDLGLDDTSAYRRGGAAAPHSVPVGKLWTGSPAPQTSS